MNTKSRIASLLEASSLDASVAGFPTFDLSELNLETELEFELPQNVRLGHLAEKVVSELIQSSTNYVLLYENVQVIQDRNTIGELDFIIQDTVTRQFIHLELAYKFYLYDPGLSPQPADNWIGPNRNDSLKEKLEKLKRKQFPLLYHESTQSKISNIPVDQVSQALCFLVSLFIPHEYKGSFSPVFEKAIKGFYLSFEAFIRCDSPAKTYYLPSKKEWGIDPGKNNTWTDLEGVEKRIDTSLKEKQAVLCWQNDNGSCSEVFVVWW